MKRWVLAGNIKRLRIGSVWFKFEKKNLVHMYIIIFMMFIIIDNKLCQWKHMLKNKDSSTVIQKPRCLCSDFALQSCLVKAGTRIIWSTVLISLKWSCWEAMVSMMWIYSSYDHINTFLFTVQKFLKSIC